MKSLEQRLAAALAFELAACVRKYQTFTEDDPAWSELCGFMDGARWQAEQNHALVSQLVACVGAAQAMVDGADLYAGTNAVDKAIASLAAELERMERVP